MSKKRYLVTGIPLSPPFDVLQGLKVGDVTEADLDADVEQLLVGGGALQPLAPEPPPKREQTKKRQPTSKEPESWRDSESRARPAEAEGSSRSAPTTSDAPRAKERGR